MERRKIRIADVESARRALKELPEQKSDEVTKREAIHALADEISTLQAKGYSKGAIAELLTKNGIAITRVLLASYLSHPLEGRSGKRKRRRKTSATNNLGGPLSAPLGAPPTTSEASSAAGEQAALESVKTASAPASGSSDPFRSEVKATSPEGAPVKAEPSPSTREGLPTNASSARRPDATSSRRKSDFLPRKDSDDI